MSASQKSTYIELPANLSQPQPPPCPPLCPLTVNHISPPHPPPDNLQNVLQHPASTPNYNHGCQLHTTNLLLTKITSQHHVDATTRAQYPKDIYSRDTSLMLASRFPSDTLHPINEVSPLIFRMLICAAPEAALIQTECDNFND